MHLRRSSTTDIPSSEITPEHAFRAAQTSRRRFLASALALGAGGAATQIPSILHPAHVLADTQKLNSVPSPYTVSDAQTPYSKATSYNNFYEFGTDKDDPARHAKISVLSISKPALMPRRTKVGTGATVLEISPRTMRSALLIRSEKL